MVILPIKMGHVPNHPSEGRTGQFGDPSAGSKIDELIMNQPLIGPITTTPTGQISNLEVSSDQATLKRLLQVMRDIGTVCS